MIENKKGQFFLIASLLIISIVFSIGILYNYTYSSNSQAESTQILADSIKRESFHLVNQGIYNNLPESSIKNNVKNLTLDYSIANPSYNITIIYGSAALNATSYRAGSFNDVPYALSPENKVNVSLNNIEYSFNITKGYNFFVILQKEDENERYIATS